MKNPISCYVTFGEYTRLKGFRSHVLYLADKDIPGGIERFTGCRSHGDLHDPRQFADDVLNDTPVKQRRYDGTEEYHDR